MARCWCLRYLLLVAIGASGKVLNFEDLGGVANNNSDSTMKANAQLANLTLQSAQPGDVVLFPNTTFHLYGGIKADGLKNVTLQFDGTLKFADDRKQWPTRADGSVMHCLEFVDAADVTFTSSGTGTLDGSGHKWWGAINYAVHRENRPRLLQVYHSVRLLVENLHFINSPYWTTYFEDIDQVTIRYCDIAVRVEPNATNHNPLELTAFNTDGFDLAGSNVHIHDVNIWNQDDCIAIKDLPPSGNYHARCSENWLVERVNASGLGLTIGSIGGGQPQTCVRNITIRDSVMSNTFKGIYLKSAYPTGKDTAVIEDILYSNITINQPEQWAIWIGPAQQVDSDHACSLLWPEASPVVKCPVCPNVLLRNITLKDITINSPKKSPGVILGAPENPIQRLVFDNVVVRGGGGAEPWGDLGYACHGVDAASVSRGGTSPVPPCFNGGKQCLPDGECRDHTDMPCCSGARHATLACGFQERCGTA